MRHYLLHQGRGWRLIWDGSFACYRLEWDRYSVKLPAGRLVKVACAILRWKAEPI